MFGSAKWPQTQIWSSTLQDSWNAKQPTIERLSKSNSLMFRQGLIEHPALGSGADIWPWQRRAEPDCNEALASLAMDFCCRLTDILTLATTGSGSDRVYRYGRVVRHLRRGPARVPGRAPRLSGARPSAPAFSRKISHDPGARILPDCLRGRGRSDGLWRKGDNLVVEPYFVDADCDMCHAGSYHLCRQMGFIGLSGGGGGLSGEIVVYARWMHPTGNIPLDEAALIEPLSVAHHAVEMFL